MKKIAILIILFLFCCGCGRKTAQETVVEYLDQYIQLDDNVLTEVDTMIASENLTEAQKDLYKDIIKREYGSISYQILSEKYTDEYAYVNTKITVLDLYKAQSDAITYFAQNKEEFYDTDGIYNRQRFMDYKLNKMNEVEDMVSYTIEFKLIKDNNHWKVLQLSNDDLEKLHGIYSYEG